jgi:hypothetical protein
MGLILTQRAQRVFHKGHKGFDCTCAFFVQKNLTGLEGTGNKIELGWLCRVLWLW